MLNTKYAQITSARASPSVFTENRHCDSMQMWYRRVGSVLFFFSNWIPKKLLYLSSTSVFAVAESAIVGTSQNMCLSSFSSEVVCRVGVHQHQLAHQGSPDIIGIWKWGIYGYE